METKNGILAIPPGETIKEQLEYKEMTQIEFARRMGQSQRHISWLLNGKAPLSQTTALKLESVLGIPAKYWNNLEALYREDLARIQELVDMDEEASIAKEIPYNDMAKKGWVPDRRKTLDKVAELRKYFEVASLKLIPNIYENVATSFRKVDRGKASPFALTAWIHKASQDAKLIEVNQFNKRKLKSSIPRIRELSNKSPKEFQMELFEILSDCGVALVFLPHLSGTYTHGATMWPSASKAVVAISIRGKDADKFWFSLFHELGHLILHDKKHAYINYDKANMRDDKEFEADEFARNTLIPLKEYQYFVNHSEFSSKEVQGFAKKVGIAPGIVVGRLQFDEEIHYSQLNSLKQQYTWTNEQYN